MSSFKTIQLHKKGTKTRDRGKIANRRKLSSVILCFFRANPTFCVLCLIFVSGIIAGIFLAQYASEEMLARLDFIFLNNFKLQDSTAFVDIFISSLASSSLLLFIVIFMGLSVWGKFTIPCVCCFRGISFGTVLSFLSMSFGFKGFCFGMLVISPGALLVSFALIICSLHSVEFSSVIAYRGLDGRKEPKHNYSVKTYRRKVQKCFLLIGISAILDTILSFLLSRLFELT